MSGTDGFFKTGVDVTHFVQTEGVSQVGNGIFFAGVDVEQLYGLTIGDFVTTILASNGANNVSLVPITDIQKLDTGSVIILDTAAATLVVETDSPATISFRSQYDTLPDGMTLDPDEVDVAEHVRLKGLFLSSFNYRFYLKDTEDGKELLEKQIYAPAAAFSVPRKARASVGIHSAPIPRRFFQIFNKDNIRNGGKIKLKRSLARNFFNTIVHKFELDTLEDKFLRGRITINQTSKDRIPVGAKTRTIKARGMRADLLGANLAAQAADRLLDRYKFGAESFSIDVFFRDGFKTEVGDIVIVDFDGLNVTNTADGTRVKPNRFFEVINKTLNIKDGATTLNLVDTAFDGSQRFGLISRASKIKSASSATVFQVKKSFSSQFATEGDKFAEFIGSGIKVRSEDGVARFDDTRKIKSVDGDQITLDGALSFTPLADDIVEFSQYDNQVDDVGDTVHLLYAFMSDTPFSDGTDQYVML